jgi:hypothetical protein
MIFWLVLKLEICYIYLEGFWLKEDFWKIIFLHGEIFEFSCVYIYIYMYVCMYVCIHSRLGMIF